MRSDRLSRLLRYLAVGIGSVAIDAILYTVLLALTGASLPSKAVSYVGGAVFSYFANWRFTFGARRGRFSEVAFALVYLSSLAVNLGVNELFLLWFDSDWWRAPAAFLVTTAFTTVWNYLGMSLFVFRAPPEDVTAPRSKDTP